MLAKQVNEYASQDKYSHSTTQNLKAFAGNLAAIQDYRDAEVYRIAELRIRHLIQLR